MSTALLDKIAGVIEYIVYLRLNHSTHTIEFVTENIKAHDKDEAMVNAKMKVYRDSKIMFKDIEIIGCQENK